MQAKRPTTTIINVIGGGILVINMLWAGVYSLIVAVQIYEASLAAGLILTFTSILFWLLGAPVWVTFTGFGFFESYEAIANKWERSIKRVTTFIGILIATWLAYLLGAFLALILTSLIAR